MKLWMYKHYKGNEYEVIAVGKHSDTLEDYVVYQAQYDSPEFGKKAIWVKSVEEFEKDIEIENKKTKRFTYIEN